MIHREIDEIQIHTPMLNQLFEITRVNLECSRFECQIKFEYRKIEKSGDYFAKMQILESAQRMLMRI